MMAILPVLKMGHPLLREKAKIVDPIFFNQIEKILKDMHDTMKAEGGIGIAAPQIGYAKQIMMFGFEQSERYPDEDSIPFTILINPTMTPLTEEQVDGFEGCLSVPGLRGLVPRYKKIEYRGMKPDGTLISRVVEGFHARVFQHEYDHLEGVLYPQRIKDMRYFGFEEMLIDPMS